MAVERVTSLSQLQDRLLHEPASMERLLLDLSINVTSMFRDPTFYAAFREKVVPAAAHVSVHADLVRGLLDRRGGLLAGDPARRRKGCTSARGSTRPTSTRTCSHRARARASSRSSEMKQYTQNYIRGGGKRDFSEYYVAGYDGARFSRSLLENVVFAQHNLAMDGAFNEFNVILCRNVMIYFDRELQERVHGLVLRQPRAVRHSRTRPQGVDRVHAASRTATRRSTQKSASTAKSREVYDAHRDRRRPGAGCKL